MSKVNIVWDASQLDTFQTCDYKFNVRYNLNKSNIFKPEALDKGDLIHTGKDAYYKVLKEGNAESLWAQAVEAGILAIRLRGVEESDLPPIEIDRNCKIFEENAKYWKPWDTEIDIIAIEQAFSYVLYEDEFFRIIMTGKIDLLFSNRAYTNTPMDTKSFSKEFPVQRQTNQFMNYAIATDSNFLFVDRVGLHGIAGEVKKPMEPHEKFKRIPLSFDPEIKEEWKADTIKWAMRYYDSASNNDWPRNRTSCNKFNRQCEYYELCDTPGESNKKFKLETNFKDIEPWDVTKGHGKV